MASDNELGDFLRSRRERVDAAAAGVVDTTRRRVAGLRREELAMLAGVSASYYARLEQGRDRNPSREVLDALARVLQLDDADRRYLHALASGPLDGVAAVDGAAVRENVRRLLRRWSDLPAFVVNPRRDVLAATALAGRVNPAWTVGANLIEFTFLDPRARDVYPDWPDIAAQAVAGLRASAADHPDVIGEFVASLRSRSDAFGELWERRDVVDRTVGYKRVAVPDVGTLELHYETFAVSGREGQALYVYFPLEGSESERALRELSPAAT